MKKILLILLASLFISVYTFADTVPIPEVGTVTDVEILHYDKHLGELEFLYIDSMGRLHKYTNNTNSKSHCFDVRQTDGHNHYINGNTLTKVTQMTGYRGSNFRIRYDYGNNFTLNDGNYYYQAPKTGMYFIQFSADFQNDGTRGTQQTNQYLYIYLQPTGKMNGETFTGETYDGSIGGVSSKWDERGYRGEFNWSGLVHLEAGTRVTLKYGVRSRSRIFRQMFMGCLMYEMGPVPSIK